MWTTIGLWFDSQMFCKNVAVVKRNIILCLQLQHRHCLVIKELGLLLMGSGLERR